MNYPAIIGLCGPAGAGKSTVAKYLVERHAYEEATFAGPLKKMVGNLFGLSEEQLYGEQKEIIDPRYHVTPRQLLQVIGTDLFRDVLPQRLPSLQFGMTHSSIWIGLLCQDVQKMRESDRRVVISDIRFANEMEVVQKMGGMACYIQRPEEDLTQTTSHVSEKVEPLMSLADKILRNNADLDHLLRTTDRILQFSQ